MAGLEKLRAALIPGKELGFFRPTAGMYFCLSFIYNMLRPLKVSLISSVHPAGAEIIPFLKVCGIIPGAVFFSYLFIKISKKHPWKQTFRIILLIFLSFYCIFGLILYPLNEVLSLDSVANQLNSWLPPGWRGFAAMIQHWPVGLFYVLCELWSSTVMFMLFWGLVNECTSFSEASWAYPLYNFAGNIAATIAGALVMSGDRLIDCRGLVSACWPGLKHRQDQISLVFFSTVIIVPLIGVVIFYLFKRMENAAETYVVRLPSLKKKERYSLADSLINVGKSKYLLYLLILVLSYNFIFNLVDVLWTKKTQEYFQQNTLKMTEFMGMVTMAKGILSTILVFCTHFVIEKFSWRTTVLVTPLIVLITGGMFFVLILMQESTYLNMFAVEAFGFSLLSLAVYLGGLQSALTRGTKYSFYDIAREMAFIPLSTMEKRKGKAVIDGIASRLGKSSGSLLYMFLFLFFNSLDATLPYVMIIMFGVAILWLTSIFRLDALMKAKHE